MSKIICAACGKPFSPNVNQRKYCPSCFNDAQRHKARIRNEMQFNREWVAWRKDFAAGRALSNV